MFFLAGRCAPSINRRSLKRQASTSVKAVTLYPLQWALMRGKRGRPQKTKVIPDPALIYGLVVKERAGRRVVKVEKRLVLGPKTSDLKVISTSLLERQNGAANSRNRSLVRNTYAFAKRVEYMNDQCALDKTVYNFCRQHRGLKG